MIFLYPNYLLFMVLPLIVFGFFIVTNKKNLERIFDDKVLQKLIVRRNSLGLVGKNILLFASLFLFIVALARPVIPKEDVELKTKKDSFAIVLDISASMFAKDIYPNRVIFAIENIKTLLKNSNSNISLYAFSDRLYQISPKSDDKKTLLFLLNNLKISQEKASSSQLEDALKHIKEKNILLFSDGTQRKDFDSIKKLNKNIITFLTATNKPTPIYKDKQMLKDKYGNIILTKANYAISKLGKVISYHDSKSLKNFSFSKEASISFSLKSFDELYIYFLSVAGVLLFFAFYSPRNLKVFVFIALFSGSYQNLQAFEITYFELQKANKLYKEKEFKKAIMIYDELSKHSKNPKLLYNRANCYYKLKEYKKAIKLYTKLVTKDMKLNYKVYFNLANSYFKLKSYKKAYEFYHLASKIKQTKKLQQNLFLLSNFYIDKDKSLKVGTKKEDITRDIKVKTFMIPLTKPKDSDESY